MIGWSYYFWLFLLQNDWHLPQKNKIIEPPHDKTNKMTWAPSNDSEQPEHPLSLTRVCCPHEEKLGPYLPIDRTVKTLIRLGGCPGWSESSLCARRFVGFVVRRLIFPYSKRLILFVPKILESAILICSRNHSYSINSEGQIF